MAENLTVKQRRALESYVLDGNVTTAAAAAGVNHEMFYRWLREPVFAGELQRLDGDALANLGRRILGLSEAAAAALSDALAEAQPMSIRLRAAAIIAERGPALAELTSILPGLKHWRRSMQRNLEARLRRPEQHGGSRSAVLTLALAIIRGAVDADAAQRQRVAALLADMPFAWLGQLLLAEDDG